MNIEKAFPRAAAIALLVQTFFWTPLALVFFMPAIKESLPSRISGLVSFYVGLLPMMIFVCFLAYGLLQEKK